MTFFVTKLLKTKNHCAARKASIKTISFNVCSKIKVLRQKLLLEKQV